MADLSGLDLEDALSRKNNSKRIRSKTIATENTTLAAEKDLKPLLVEDKKTYNTKERMIKKVPPPIAHRLTEKEIFTGPNGVPNHELLQKHFFGEGRLEISAAKAILQKAREIFAKEPNLLELKPPLVVCGDTHGQYYDLVNVLKAAGSPVNTQYLFLGDYVDRGCFSTDVCLLLCAFKICYPGSFHMLRGNHECRLMTSYFNFKLECTKKYSEEVYNVFMDLFDALPLCASVTTKIGTILCMHGGLSPEVDSLEDIKVIDRFMEPPKTGPLCDLIWSDPIEEDTAEGLTEEEMEEWYDVQFVENPTRGCGFIFGYAAVMQFLEANNLLLIVRAHEVQAEGYHLHHFLKKDREHPPCVTVFSAPNYCDMYNNKAAMMVITEEGYTFKQVGWAEHPFYLPDMMDGLTWSFPFVIENLTELSLAILKLVQQGIKPTEEDKLIEAQMAAEKDKEKKPSDQFNTRLRSVRSMLTLMHGITKERDKMLEFKKFADIGAGPDVWKKIKDFDKDNERLPNSKGGELQMGKRRRRTKTI